MEEKINVNDPVIRTYLIEDAIQLFQSREQDHIIDSTTLMTGVLESRRSVLLDFLDDFIRRLRQELNVVPPLDVDQWYSHYRTLVPFEPLYRNIVYTYFDQFQRQYEEALHQSQSILWERIRNYIYQTKPAVEVTDVPDIFCFSECGICLDDSSPTNIQLLPCNHCFHEECIIPWLSQKNVCPFCRNQVNEVLRDSLSY